MVQFFIVIPLLLVIAKSVQGADPTELENLPHIYAHPLRRAAYDTSVYRRSPIVRFVPTAYVDRDSRKYSIARSLPVVRRQIPTGYSPQMGNSVPSYYGPLSPSSPSIPPAAYIGRDDAAPPAAMPPTFAYQQQVVNQPRLYPGYRNNLIAARGFTGHGDYVQKDVHRKVTGIKWADTDGVFTSMTDTGPRVFAGPERPVRPSYPTNRYAYVNSEDVPVSGSPSTIVPPQYMGQSAFGTGPRFDQIDPRMIANAELHEGRPPKRQNPNFIYVATPMYKLYNPSRVYANHCEDCGGGGGYSAHPRGRPHHRFDFGEDESADTDDDRITVKPSGNKFLFDDENAGDEHFDGVSVSDVPVDSDSNDDAPPRPPPIPEEEGRSLSQTEEDDLWAENLLKKIDDENGASTKVTEDQGHEESSDQEFIPIGSDKKKSHGNEDEEDLFDDFDEEDNVRPGGGPKHPPRPVDEPQDYPQEVHKPYQPKGPNGGYITGTGDRYHGPPRRKVFTRRFYRVGRRSQAAKRESVMPPSRTNR